MKSNLKVSVYFSFLIPALIITAVVLSSGCTILKTGDVPEDEIKIGVLLPFSGNMEVYGTAFKEGIEMAVSDINSRGGIRGVPVRAEYQNSFGTPNIAVFGFRKFADEGINVIIGDASSTNTLRIAPLAEEYGVVLVSPGATAPGLSDYKNFVFRTISSDTYQGRGIAKVLRSLYPEAKNVSVVYVDNDYGSALAEAFSNAFTGSGGHIGHKIDFFEGGDDYTDVGRELKENDPDAVVLISYSGDAAQIMNSARLQGMDDTIWIGSEGLIDEDLIARTGEYSEGMVATMQANRIISESFARRYKEEYNKTAVDWPVPYGYDTMMIVAQAIGAKGYDPEDISEGLKEIRYVGVCGAKSFDENGDIYPSYDVLQVQDGEWVQIRWNEILYGSTSPETHH
ncbi:MAG: ABC transporter substrate-binding protein [Methanomicrobiaceae archaeon]|nr:ABC transporter substrate-binding protein [Methanomicrobiaceae archaeon]